MKSEDFNGLDVARFRLRLTAAQDASLPAFLGSTLRGAFGHALKQAVCVMSHKACERCLVQDRCLYPYLFETPAPADSPMLKGQSHAPHPFILTPEFHAALDSNARQEADRLAVPWSRGKFEAPGTYPERHPPDIDADSAFPSNAAQAGLRPAASQPAGLDSGVAQTVSLCPVASQPAGLHPGSNNIFAPRRGEGRFIRPLPGPRTFLKAGESLSFELVLIGRAIDYLPYIVFAVSEMAHRGLGVARNRFELDDVTMVSAAGAERPIYSGRTQKIATPSDSRSTLSELIRARLASLAPELRTPSLPPLRIPNSELRTGVTPRSAFRISFLSPTRIRIDGEPQSVPSFELLIRSLLRRLSMLFSVHGCGGFDVDHRGLIERARSVRFRSSNLRWWDFERYSNRQQRKMKLGGFVGEIEYAASSELIEEFLPLFAAGEILHIGSGTAFGLGLYRAGLRD